MRRLALIFAGVTVVGFGFFTYYRTWSVNAKDYTYYQLFSKGHVTVTDTARERIVNAKIAIDHGKITAGLIILGGMGLGAAGYLMPYVKKRETGG